ncbi:hypothetical protein VTO42DRAFT_389 [Malbranchea cinnamomea]
MHTLRHGSNPLVAGIHFSNAPAFSAQSNSGDSATFTRSPRNCHRHGWLAFGRAAAARASEDVGLLEYDACGCGLGQEQSPMIFNCVRAMVPPKESVEAFGLRAEPTACSGLRSKDERQLCSMQNVHTYIILYKQ